MAGLAMTKIYVGNLPSSATEGEVRQLFAQCGRVDSVTLPLDRGTGDPRGFGFVEMPTSDAARAILTLNGRSLRGCSLRVNEALERTMGSIGRGRP
jgi:RNA recognition motif-containing protein